MTAPPAPDPFAALVPLGWDDRRRAQWSAAPPGSRPGRVIRADRGRVMVQTTDELTSTTAVDAPWPGHDEAAVPTTGDWVAVAMTEGAEAPDVVGVMPRSSSIARLDALGREEQILAANVDFVFVVHGLDRPLKPGRIERSLVLAWESGAVPVVVVTKSDLADDPDDIVRQIGDLAPGVAVYAVSATTGIGLDRLRAVIAQDRTAVLLGESGSGKSSLANRMLGGDVQATSSVRRGDAKGRHTTVTRDLLVVPDGGVLIDTPGLRGVGLSDVEDGLALAFPDIEELSTRCRFSDCRHDTEPGCAVKTGATAGELDPDRLDRYLSMRAEADAADLRRDASALRERKRQDKASQRAWRRGPQRHR